MAQIKTCKTHDTTYSSCALIDFHNTVDLPDKPEAGKKSNGSCEQEKCDHHDTGVAEV